MLTVLSPAKKLEDSAPPIRCGVELPKTAPVFADTAAQIATMMRQQSAAELKKLMRISDKLVELNLQRYRDFSAKPAPDSTRQAALMFRGDVYQGLEADTLEAADFDYAQEHVGILSGLYGFLRPLDGIQPYRLEMGLSLPVGEAKNLHAFWRDKITSHLNQRLAEQENPILINLASNEYFKAIDAKALRHPVIEINFKEWRGGQPKVIGLLAKRARGLMTRFIIRNRVDTPEGLKDFASDGYKFLKQQSTERKFIFQR